MNIRGLIHRMTTDDLARNSAIVLGGTMTANVLSYVYHLIMGRLLGPAGYGELSSLLSLLYIFTVPLIVAQTVLVKFISGFKAHGEVGQAKSLYLSATKLFGLVCVILFPVMLIAGPLVISFLHLSSLLLLVLLYALLAVSLMTVVSGSILNGYQKFVWVSIMGALSILVKLVLSIPLTSWYVPGVLLAAVIASIIIYAAYFIPLRFLFRAKTRPANVSKRDAYGFALPVLFLQLGITSIYSTDIILVRHFFDARTSGLYAALAILGKIIFYASAAVPTVLFPIAAERQSKGAKTNKLTLGAIAAVAAISCAVTLIYFLFPGFIVGLLFGTAYTGAAPLLGMFGIFLSLFSIGNIIATACLATGKLYIWIIAAGSALIQILAITVSHPTITAVIAINIGVCLLYDVAAGGYYLSTMNRRGTAA